VIVGHWKRLQAAGGTLVLAGARYRYTKTLWITGLADRLPLFDNVEAALAAEAQAAPADLAPPDGQAAAGAPPKAKRRAAPG
jgi:hypothetical protein